MAGAEILPWLPRREDGAPLRILDLGTGAGFFAILLAQAGCEGTGIDLSEGMLAQAAALADEAGCTVDWRCMSATELDFGEAAFDGVLARNLTWTLTDPEAAYAEWLRVLRPGGVLLNFDADYGAVDFTRLADEQGQHAHADMDRALLQEAEAIRRKGLAEAEAMKQKAEAYKQYNDPAPAPPGAAAVGYGGPGSGGLCPLQLRYRAQRTDLRPAGRHVQSCPHVHPARVPALISRPVAGMRRMGLFPAGAGVAEHAGRGCPWSIPFLI